MRAYCTRRLSMILGWASGSAVTLPLQPNHNPPWVWNASRTATARPPAAPLPVGSGAATRFETTTSRGKCLLQYHRWKRSGREGGWANRLAEAQCAMPAPCTGCCRESSADCVETLPEEVRVGPWVG